MLFRSALVVRVRAGLQPLLGPAGWTLMPSSTPIKPLVIGGNAQALAVMQDLAAEGLWVPAIRPPTVPEGSARLRIALSAAHTEADIDRLLEALAHAALRGGH